MNTASNAVAEICEDQKVLEEWDVLIKTEEKFHELYGHYGDHGFLTDTANFRIWSVTDDNKACLDIDDVKDLWRSSQNGGNLYLLPYRKKDKRIFLGFRSKSRQELPEKFSALKVQMRDFLSRKMLP